MTLRVSDDLTLPVDVAGEAIAILAKRGAGKTNTAKVLVEGLHDAGVQVVVLDPVGVWWGLRASAEGKSFQGIAVPVLGGAHGDVPLEAAAGSLIADVAVDTGQSLVIDLSGFTTKRDQVTFVREFSERLYRRKATEQSLMHVVLEEADEFAPQKPMRDEAVMLNRVEALVRRGRSRGIGLTMISQRSASLNKGVLTQADVLVVMRTLAPQDRKAVEAWVESHADRGEAKEMLDSLPGLQNGEAWVWNPERDLFARVQVDLARTYDSSSTPKAGAKDTAARRMKSIDLDVLGKQIVETAERAKENDPTVLRRRIALLERQADQASPAREVEVVREVPVEVPVLNGEVEELEKAAAALREAAETVESAASSIVSALDRWSGRPRAEQVERREASRPAPSPARRPVPPAAEPTGDVTLGGGERKILESLASHYPMRVTRAQLGTLSGYSHKGGTFQKYFSILKREGLIVESGGEISITDAGLDLFGGTPPAPKTPDEMLEMWRGALEGGPRKLLDELVKVHPYGLGREELGQLTGYESSGGTFQKYLSILRRNELVTVAGGEVRVSDTLCAGAPA